VLGYDPGTLVGDRTFEPLTVGDVHRIESVRETATGEMPAGAATEGRTAATETWYRILGKREGADADTVRFEVVLRTDDGSERTIEAYARYLVDDPAAEGIVINARDITERRGRERELERTNERLDRFASVVSHDLRNPLGVASGYLELAAEGDTDAIDEVRKQYDRMETMTADLLTMARGGGEIADDELAEVSLEAAARRAWRNVDTGGADPEAGVESGDLTVTVETVPDGFAVSDDGVGIPAEHRGGVRFRPHDRTGQHGVRAGHRRRDRLGPRLDRRGRGKRRRRRTLRDTGGRPTADQSAADRLDPPAGEVE
jgi:signal transduction histidine kinase